MTTLVPFILESSPWGLERKENEKVEKYTDLCRELGKLWKVRCSVVPVVVRALGTDPKRLPHIWHN